MSITHKAEGLRAGLRFWADIRMSDSRGVKHRLIACRLPTHIGLYWGPVDEQVAV